MLPYKHLRIGILLTALLLQTAGPLLFLQLQLLQVRREVKHAIMRGLPDADLVQVLIRDDGRRVDGRAVEWEHDREFRCDGVMYDVVRSASEGDMTRYFCVRDDEETAVFAQLDQLSHEESSSNPARQGSRERVLHQLLTPFLQSPAASLRSPEHSATYAQLHSRMTISRPQLPPDPPPRG
ncbi:hypothetical protein KQI65_15675 [bacterium]|nr:hypothetical protein [bacterium]